MPISSDEAKVIESQLTVLGQEVDALGRSLAQFVKELEQDDRLRERAEASQDRDRDRREQELDRQYESLASKVTALGVALIDTERRLSQQQERSLEVLRQSLENIGVALRDLPERLFNQVERKIYELRIERHEARKDGVSNEPAPLPPVPTVREPTSKIIALIEGREHDDSPALTAAQQRSLLGLAKKAWSYKWHAAGASGVGVAAHWLWDRVVDLYHFVSAAHH